MALFAFRPARPWAGVLILLILVFTSVSLFPRFVFHAREPPAPAKVKSPESRPEPPKPRGPFYKPQIEDKYLPIVENFPFAAAASGHVTAATAFAATGAAAGLSLVASFAARGLDPLRS